MSFACSSPAGGMLFGVSGLLLLLLLEHQGTGETGCCTADAVSALPLCKVPRARVVESVLVLGWPPLLRRRVLEGASGSTSPLPFARKVCVFLGIAPAPWARELGAGVRRATVGPPLVAPRGGRLLGAVCISALGVDCLSPPCRGVVRE